MVDNAQTSSDEIWIFSSAMRSHLQGIENWRWSVNRPEIPEHIESYFNVWILGNYEWSMDHKFVASFLRQESRRNLCKNKPVDATGKGSRAETNHNRLVFPGLRMRPYRSLFSARTISSERCESVALIETRCARCFLREGIRVRNAHPFSEVADYALSSVKKIVKKIHGTNKQPRNIVAVAEDFNGNSRQFSCIIECLPSSVQPGETDRRVASETLMKSITLQSRRAT